MSRRRFRWSRKLYRQAHSLARLMGRHLYELHHQPNLVRRYFELWDRHAQCDDPLLVPVRRRLDIHVSGKDIPF